MSTKFLAAQVVEYETSFGEISHYYVSSIDRERSSGIGGEYTETLVWTWNVEDQKREKLIYQTGAFTPNNLYKHKRVIEVLSEFGEEGLLEKEI